MKSFAVMLAAVNLLSGSQAVEHPLLTSTHDFQENWTDKPVAEDMLSELKDL